MSSNNPIQYLKILRNSLKTVLTTIQDLILNSIWFYNGTHSVYAVTVLNTIKQLIPNGT